MKTLDQQDHYEVLELPRGARTEDVERAYPLVRGAYEKHSLALYSLYDEHASQEICERIDLAYRVLSDDEARRDYDESIGIDPPVEAPVVTRRSDESFSRASASAGPAAVAGGLDAEPAHAERTLEAIEEIEDEASNEFGGARLRRARLRAGQEIDDVSKLTKIRLHHLKAIEEEHFHELPADVYVRGFVAAYARALGLDANAVAKSYMERCSEARDSQPARRLFGR